MTTLKLETEVELMVRERAFLSSRALPGEEIEMEARLGVKPGASGTSGLFWINAYKFVRAMPGKRTWANYTHTVISDPVISFRQRDGSWSVKKEVRSVPLSNHWAKLALSTEAFSGEPSIPELQDPNASELYKPVVRHIARHSFYIGSSRVDFTKTYTNGELTFEVEIEYLAPALRVSNPQRDWEAYQRRERERKAGTNPEAPSVAAFPPSYVKEHVEPFIELIYSITSAMFQTPLPFTYEMLLTVSGICNALLARSYEDKDIRAAQYLNRNYLSDAGPLDIKHLNSGWFFKGGRTWTCTLKTDYQRMTLVICDQGTWLLFPPLQAALYAKNDVHTLTRLTIVDGELDRSKNELWLLDALWVDGVDVRGVESHLKRYEQFRAWQETVADQRLFEGLTIRYKKHNILTWNSFFTEVESVWESRHGAGYKVDGLIFTPNVRYQDGTDPNNRIVLKWKPEITIDLIVNKDSKGNLVVLSARDDESSLSGKVEEQFRGSDMSRLMGIDMAGVTYNRGAIVEFACRDSRLVAVLERSEKTGPNRSDHAIDSWLKATVDTLRVDAATLTGKNNVLMRKYHNRIKDDLFRRAAATSSEGLVLLDIGSGRGGDLQKMKNHGYSKIICVEPNEDSLDELERRLREMEPEFQDRVFTLKAHGEDWREIKQFAIKNGITKVDVVSMMDSLTYFFEPGGASLTSLARTVNSLLGDGGLFIWRSLDGASVSTVFEQTGESELVYGDSKITSLGGNRVRVDIPPNQLGIEEYLTNVQQLKAALNLSGEVEMAQDEWMLTNAYISLSKLYAHGVFTKGKKLAPTREMTEILKVENLRKIASNQVPYCNSIIEAIETAFTNVRHSILVSEYQTVCKARDPRYSAVGTEPEYHRFETAYLGYFSSLFIERSKSDPYVVEVEILSSADVTDANVSLAFASLLGIDVFVVNEELLLIAGPLTNAIHGRTDNPCCVVVWDEKGFYLRPFASGFPLALSSDPAVAGYERHASDDFHASIIASVGSAEERGELFRTNKKVWTRVLDRIAYVADVPAEIRLLSLANALINRPQSKTSGAVGKVEIVCREADLEKCGITGDQQALIAYVNKKIAELLKPFTPDR